MAPPWRGHFIKSMAHDLPAICQAERQTDKPPARRGNSAATKFGEIDLIRKSWPS